MSRWEAWLVHLATVLVGGTGVVYAWMRYLLPPADPYAVVNHPLQPTVQHLHVLLAPLLVFAAGLIFREHVWKHWRRGVERRRTSGLGLLFVLVPMIVSGYLIQTATGETWRLAWVVIHCATGGLWLAAYAAHALEGWRRRSRRRRPARAAAESEPARLDSVRTA